MGPLRRMQKPSVGRIGENPTIRYIHIAIYYNGMDLTMNVMYHTNITKGNSHMLK